eukprot:gene11092-18706_t
MTADIDSSDEEEYDYEDSDSEEYDDSESVAKPTSSKPALEYEMTMLKSHSTRELKPFLLGTLAAHDEVPDRGLDTADDDVESILSAMPVRLQEAVRLHLQRSSPLMEVAVDDGRDVVLRFVDGSRLVLAGVQVPISEAMECLLKARNGSSKLCRKAGFWKGAMSREQSGSFKGAYQEEPRQSQSDQPMDPSHADPFSSDGRMGVAGTLHRISGIRNRDGRVYGLTYRISRHMPGIADIFMDILSSMCDKVSTQMSLLVLGPPGAGKTTLLRDISRQLADVCDKLVIVIDTSNEIGGEGERPHPCIGGARRFMVPHRAQQHATMIEAVQNHTPQVLIVDEIGTAKEVAAVNDIAQRGVLMVGTAHGTTLTSLLKNKALVPLVGDVRQVIVGDEAAGRGSKTKLERQGPPAFTALIEVLGNNRWRVHLDLAESVDRLLKGLSPGADPREPSPTHSELRRYSEDHKMVVSFETKLAAKRAAPGTVNGAKERSLLNAAKESAVAYIAAQEGQVSRAAVVGSHLLVAAGGSFNKMFGRRNKMFWDALDADPRVEAFEIQPYLKAYRLAGTNPASLKVSPKASPKVSGKATLKVSPKVSQKVSLKPSLKASPKPYLQASLNEVNEIVVAFLATQEGQTANSAFIGKHLHDHYGELMTEIRHSYGNKKVWKALEADPRIKAFMIKPDCKAYRLVTHLSSNNTPAKARSAKQSEESKASELHASDKFDWESWAKADYENLGLVKRIAVAYLAAQEGQSKSSEVHASDEFAFDESSESGDSDEPDEPESDKPESESSVAVLEYEMRHKLVKDMSDNNTPKKGMSDKQSGESKASEEFALEKSGDSEESDGSDESDELKESKEPKSNEPKSSEAVLEYEMTMLQALSTSRELKPLPPGSPAVQDAPADADIPTSEAMACLMKARDGSSTQEKETGFWNVWNAEFWFGPQRGEPREAAQEEPFQASADQPMDRTRANPFSSDGRMGVAGTLHRISGIRNRDGKVYGLTYRISRHMPGIADIFMDILSSMCDKDSTQMSLLVLGPPGAGKTTLLRDISRQLADVCGKSVIVIDTSNEIGGEGERPHPCIGGARRFMVPQRLQQHATMIEAVQNHTPQVLIVDEIGTAKNKTLVPLVGGVRQVTVGDGAAEGGSKTKLERSGPPAFTALMEVWRVHLDLAESVDLLLKGLTPGAVSSQAVPTHTEIRRYSQDQKMVVSFETKLAAKRAAPGTDQPSEKHPGQDQGMVVSFETKLAAKRAAPGTVNGAEADSTLDDAKAIALAYIAAQEVQVARKDALGDLLVATYGDSTMMSKQERKEIWDALDADPRVEAFFDRAERQRISTTSDTPDTTNKSRVSELFFGGGGGHRCGIYSSPGQSGFWLVNGAEADSPLDDAIAIAVAYTAAQEGQVARKDALGRHLGVIGGNYTMMSKTVRKKIFYALDADPRVEAFMINPSLKAYRLAGTKPTSPKASLEESPNSSTEVSRKATLEVSLEVFPMVSQKASLEVSLEASVNLKEAVVAYLTTRAGQVASSSDIGNHLHSKYEHLLTAIGYTSNKKTFWDALDADPRVEAFEISIEPYGKAYRLAGAKPTSPEASPKVSQTASQKATLNELKEALVAEESEEPEPESESASGVLASEEFDYEDSDQSGGPRESVEPDEPESDEPEPKEPKESESSESVLEYQMTMLQGPSTSRELKPLPAGSLAAQDPSADALAGNDSDAMDDDVESLLSVMPVSLQDAIRPHSQGLLPLMEVAVDDGRDVVLTFVDGTQLVQDGVQVKGAEADSPPDGALASAVACIAAREGQVAHVASLGKHLDAVCMNSNKMYKKERNKIFDALDADPRVEAFEIKPSYKAYRLAGTKTASQKATQKAALEVSLEASLNELKEVVVAYLATQQGQVASRADIQMHLHNHHEKLLKGSEQNIRVKQVWNALEADDRVEMFQPQPDKKDKSCRLLTNTSGNNTSGKCVSSKPTEVLEVPGFGCEDVMEVQVLGLKDSDSGDSEEAVESNEPDKPDEPKETREINEPKGSEEEVESDEPDKPDEPKESKEPTESEEAVESNEPDTPDETKKSKGLNDSKASKEPKDPSESEEAVESDEPDTPDKPKESKELKESKGPKEATEPESSEAVLEYQMTMLQAPSNSRELKPLPPGSLAAQDLSADAEPGSDSDAMDDDVESLLSVMPVSFQDAIRPHSQGPLPLMDVAVDDGRDVVLSFVDGTQLVLNGVQVPMSEAMECLLEAKYGSSTYWVPMNEAMECLLKAKYGSSKQWRKTGLWEGFMSRAQRGGFNGPSQEETSQAQSDPTRADPFSSDGRMGVAGTLHRISGIRNRDGRVYGLTYRISRHMPGIADIFMDILSSMCDKDSTQMSLLVLGLPGKSVIVIDTSNEIGGDGERPHPCIGRARRFMVPHRAQQHATMIEAVQNHTPQVLIVDEIGTSKEVEAVNDIAQRGVLMVGTAHGTTLTSLLKNKALVPLIGGVRQVTIGDKAAGGRSKTKLERSEPPAFTALIKVLGKNRWRVHLDLAESVDLLLKGMTPGAVLSQAVPTHTELRRYSQDQKMVVSFETKLAAQRAAPGTTPSPALVMGKNWELLSRLLLGDDAPEERIASNLKPKSQKDRQLAQRLRELRTNLKKIRSRRYHSMAARNIKKLLSVHTAARRTLTLRDICAFSQKMKLPDCLQRPSTSQHLSEARGVGGDWSTINALWLLGAQYLRVVEFDAGTAVTKAGETGTAGYWLLTGSLSHPAPPRTPTPPAPAPLAECSTSSTFSSTMDSSTSISPRKAVQAGPGANRPRGKAEVGGGEKAEEGCVGKAPPVGPPSGLHALDYFGSEALTGQAYSASLVADTKVCCACLLADDFTLHRSIAQSPHTA